MVWMRAGALHNWTPTLFMTCINIKHYQKVKDLIHPNITDNIDYYRNLYILLAYDGCGLRNRNGFHKRIDYSRGHQCVLQTSKPDWRRTKEKNKIQRVHSTGYQMQYNNQYLARVKGNYYYNHRTKE